jgi:hypothetical protein
VVIYVAWWLVKVCEADKNLQLHFKFISAVFGIKCESGRGEGVRKGNMARVN